MRDTKGRFKSKDLLFPLPSTTMILNMLVLVFIFLHWIYVGLKYNIIEKINNLLNSFFLIIQNANAILMKMAILNISKRQK